MMRTLLALLLSAAGIQAQWRVMPMPSSIRAGEGRLALRQGFAVELAAGSETDPRLSAAIERIQARISGLTGIAASGHGAAGLSVRIAHAANPVQSLEEDESYRLVIDSRQAALTAPNTLGGLHGLETFFQLLENTREGWGAPAVVIDDHPRFAWRGLLLDVVRHFMPLDVVRRTLDGMAAVKLNVFHWHLSDDQGFRVESKTFPKLHELGSDGNYYTQEQVRGVIQYARDRGIRVVPEFDVPGHTASWLVGYPELAAAPGPFHILRSWSLNEPTLDPAKPEVYTFLDVFIGEMAALFPDAWLHIGGDEVNGREWNANTTDIPAFMREHGFTTQHDLQAWFNQQVQKIVAKHGRKMEGWDEILNPDILIQSWRGAKSVAEGARQGYPSLLSAGYYLDHVEPAAKMYQVDPLGGEAASLSAAEKQRILGGEACLWTEYVSPANVDSRLWPRVAAVAERLWSPAEVKDVGDMYRRLALMDAELDQMGLRQNSGYQAMLEQLAGSKDTETLQVLTDVLEPGGLGVRKRANRNYSQSTPLNRLVDVARPDSRVARHFSELVTRYVANRGDSTARDEIRKWLLLWSGNDAKLRPLVARRPALQEAGLVSAALARMASAALALPNRHVITVPKPIAEVNLAVAPAINRLIAMRR